MKKERDSLAATVKNLRCDIVKTFKRQLIEYENTKPNLLISRHVTYPDNDRTPRIDGKEFFRQARSRLSYEQFRAFLANIKELNAQNQNQRETLRRADEIIGAENKDLYLCFHGLVNKNKS